MAALKGPVQVVGHPGQKARILQQGKEREKDGHGRQHHRDHRGKALIGPVQQQALQPGRGAQGGKVPAQQFFQQHKASAQPCGGEVGAPDGEIADPQQQKQHHREGPGFSRKDPVQPGIPCAVGPLLPGDGERRKPRRLPGEGGGEQILHRRGRKAQVKPFRLRRPPQCFACRQSLPRQQPQAEPALGEALSFRQAQHMSQRSFQRLPIGRGAAGRGGRVPEGVQGREKTLTAPLLPGRDAHHRQAQA